MVNPRPSRKYIILEPLVLALVMVIGISIGYKINDTEDDFALIQRLDESAVPIGRIEEILRFVENKYVDSIDTEKIENQLIETVLQDLDPHSIYIPPADLEDVNRQMSGKFQGIGIETLLIKDTFYISYIMENSPAEKAGLPIGAKILSVNDSIVSGKELKYQELSELVIQDDEVILNVDIKNENKNKNFTLIPTEFAVNSAQNHFLLEPGVGYIQLERFTSNSYSDFLRALETIVTDQNLDNLIIDLRNNPGGYLPETSKILSQLFKEKDRLLLYTEGEKSEKQEYKTTGKCFFDVGNIAVLINEGSASGSEILAGAIQDWDRGVIIGSRSYGKGLVQEQYSLANGGAIRLTVAKYFTPTGRLIQKDYKSSEYDYRTEIDNRQIYGDAYLNDTSEYSLSFRTMKLKRSVEGGGGIQPDISVAFDKNRTSSEYYNLFRSLEELLFIKNLQERIALNSDQDLEAVLDEMKSLLEVDGFSEMTINKYAYLLEEDTRILLAKWNEGKISAKKVELSLDVDVQEALKVFNDKILLSEFVF